MIVRYLAFSMLFLFGCKDPGGKAADSLIDKDKIKGLFQKDANGVRLDHLYMVLDSSSYSELLSNTYIRDSFGGMDLGMPGFEPADKSATSVYLRGEEEYIEILGSNNVFKEPVGQYGLGFSLNVPTEFSLKNRPLLTENGTKLLQGLDTVSFKIKERETIWYTAFYTFGMRTNLYTWYSYYNPGFLTALYEKDVEEYSQKLFLETAYDSHKLFKRITKIELRCTKADHYRIAKELQLLGCSLRREKNGDLLCRLGQVDLHIVLDENLKKSMVSRMDGLLNREDNRTINFEHLKIRNNGLQTSWTFGAFQEF